MSGQLNSIKNYRGLYHVVMIKQSDFGIGRIEVLLQY